jgi:hypothetical protein
MAAKKNRTRLVKAAEEPQPALQPTGAGERPVELPTPPAGATPFLPRTRVVRERFRSDRSVSQKLCRTPRPWRL